jgi:dTDP-4-amino-4,6-dideoxygalactose transaminase
MITTLDPGFAARLRRLRAHAMSTSAFERSSSISAAVETYDEIGFNYRMTDIQVAVRIVQLGRLEELIANRRRQAAVYEGGLTGIGAATLPTDPPYGETNHQSYWVMLDSGDDRRDSIIALLAEAGIASKPIVMAAHREAVYADRGPFVLPVTEDITDHGFLLPLYHAMTANDLARVIEAVQQAMS